jgi:hypothetical protein
MESCIAMKMSKIHQVQQEMDLIPTNQTTESAYFMSLFLESKNAKSIIAFVRKKSK